MTVAQAGSIGGRKSHGGGRPRTPRQEVASVERRLSSGRLNEGDAIAELEAYKPPRSRPVSRPAARSAPKSAPKRAPVRKAYRPAINADYRHLKAIVLAKYHKRVVAAKYMFKMDNETIGNNLHAGAITGLQARKAYARAEKVFRAEMFNAEEEKRLGLAAIGKGR